MAHSYPAPMMNPEAAPFFDAASCGQLLLKKCLSCGAFHYYPRTMCPFCGSDETTWSKASGDGVVYSISIMRRGVEEPFAIAYVALEEGVTILSNIESADLDGVGIGHPVRVSFRTTEGGTALPIFVPA